MSTFSAVAASEAALVEAFKALDLPIQYAVASPPNRNSSADLQCNGALALAKAMGRHPADIANAIAEQLTKGAWFSVVEVAGPGFINLTLSDAVLNRCLAAQLASAGAGVLATDTPQTIVLDFGGPNVAKPLHVGHLRSLVLGESLRRILVSVGHKVISDIHLGDWGLQMGQLISELEIHRPELPYFDPAFTGPYPETPPISLADLELMYPAAAAACKRDPARLQRARLATSELQEGRPGYRALWAHFRSSSLDSILTDIDRLGAHFDLLAGESDAQRMVGPMVEELLAKGVAVHSEGAVVIEVYEPDDGDRPLPPLILLKSDGASMYGTTDLATIKQRVDAYQPDRICYVVDQRQADHFTQVFRAAAKVGLGPQLVHIGFGTVNGADGKPLKTRVGGTVKLGDLIAAARAKAAAALRPEVVDRDQLVSAIAIAAIKFADLSSKRLTGYIFDLDRAVSFEGKTGPYLQYAAVRVSAILKKAGPQELRFGAQLGGTERALALLCLSFPAAVERAIESYEPSEIAGYAFDLAQAFSRFYADSPVLAEADDQLRNTKLALCKLTSNILGEALWLLGIEVPEAM